MKTSVALFIFNRPDTTEQVFKVISQAKPSKLLVIADGPRAERPGEAEKCAAARAIIEHVDWECQVITNYSDINLGCLQRMSSGLNWVFETVEEAIIFEDDCLPHLTFFRFCDELLEYYRNNEKVMHITGTNLIPQKDLATSFWFSRLVPIWGWATWRRAWQKYDIEMKLWPAYKEINDLQYFGRQKENVYRVFEEHFLEQVSESWDARWAFTCLVNQGLSIIPKTNLITNIGFRPDGTHTLKPSKVSSLPLQAIEFPLKKPFNLSPCQKNDEQYLEFQNGKNTLMKRLKNLTKTILKLRIK